MSGADAKSRVLALLDRVGIQDPQRTFDSYPHQISGGMAQRVLIAGAVASRPELLIADEPTTALDVTVQAEILDLIRDLQAELNMAVLLVTHNFGVVADICDRVAVMQNGQVVEIGHGAGALPGPEHPYTQMLLGSILDEHGRPDRPRPCPPRRPLGRETDDYATSGRDRPPRRFFRPWIPCQGHRGPARGVPEHCEGETLGVVGESGSGKTTIGRAVLGLVNPAEEASASTGADITHASAQGTPHPVQGHPGRLPGPLHLAEPVADDRGHPQRAAGGAGRRRARDARTRVQTLLDQVGLPRTRPSVCRASSAAASVNASPSPAPCAPEPKLIVCDEPVSRTRPVHPGPGHRPVHRHPAQHRSGLPVRLPRPAVVRHISHRVSVVYRATSSKPDPRTQSRPHPSTLIRRNCCWRHRSRIRWSRRNAGQNVTGWPRSIANRTSRRASRDGGSADTSRFPS